MAFMLFLGCVGAITGVQWVYGIAFLGKDAGFLIKTFEKINDYRLGNTIQERYRKRYFQNFILYLILGIALLLAPNFLSLSRDSEWIILLSYFCAFIFIISIVAQVLLLLFQNIGLGVTYYFLALVFQYISTRYLSAFIGIIHIKDELTYWNLSVLLAMVIGTLILANEIFQFDNTSTANKSPSTIPAFKISISKVIAGLLAVMGAIITIRDFGEIVINLFR